jgi:phosphoribosyl-ATP pyrophosphohydrolase
MGFSTIVAPENQVGKAIAPVTPAPLDKLERTIADRATNPKEKSYTNQLLAGGVEKIGAKVIEEAAEVVEAASEKGKAGREHFVREVGDLVYHLLVLMQHKKCTLIDLEAELSRRFGLSGLEEKAARKTKGPKTKVGSDTSHIAGRPTEKPPYG